MNKFKSINYAIVKCIDCGAVTEIQPDKVFTKLNCNCKASKKESKRVTKNDTSASNKKKK